ncbi:MAG: hypothetical protein N3B12_01330 [Armatimonadetes bacterium]|nr:hypothetical protein [Armatimonadota bacterium]
MKKYAAWLMASLMLCSPCWAQEDKPPLDLRVYPGGSSTMEINMTSEEFLQMLQVTLPIIGPVLGKFGEMLVPEAVGDVLKDVKRIEFLQVDVAQKGVTNEQIAKFYAKNLPPGRWSRVLWMFEAQSGAIGLYSQQNTDQLYGFYVSTVTVDGKRIKRATVVKIEGRVDYAKLVELVTSMGAKLPQSPPVQ